jgi:hypothetical protein
MAREALLDAIEALVAQLDAIIVVGAQAIYLHTGSADVAIAEFTTDGDLALDPEVLSSDPLVNEAMRQARFEPDPRSGAIGTWISHRGVPVDLMVPDAVAGVGRRGVRVPPHDPKAMRRARGLEAALVDNSPMLIGALDPASDPRGFTVAIAGPAALLVAKLHKIHDRIDTPDRLNDKDAHDVYRLLRAIEADDLTAALSRLLRDPLSSDVTREALDYLDLDFATGANAKGSLMAGAAEWLVGDPATRRP